MSEMLQPSARSELEATPLVNSDFQEAVATVLLPCTATQAAPKNAMIHLGNRFPHQFGWVAFVNECIWLQNLVL